VTSAGAKGIRRCTRTGCPRPAVSTLTYVYADSTAVLGPLASIAEPHSYDLCADHATRLTAPRGWDVVRLGSDHTAPAPGPDDLIALADAVREAARRRPAAAAPAAGPGRAAEAAQGGGPRRSHLRVLRDDLS
jgi:Protein of unknown function (DUF3499)